ncbi:hypothetical protein C0992_002355 [Termitomyces sp. T32_za158]|nr:hypothetical protein C0992_002355 [Termitomyces sp. T32_za158]
MPFQKKSKFRSESDSSVRTINAQLKTLDPERLKAILASVSTGPPCDDRQTSIVTTPSASPSKRKNASSPDRSSAPSTLSPKKIRASADDIKHSSVLRMMDDRKSLGTEPPSVPVTPSRPRTLSVKALAAKADAETNYRQSKVLRIYPEVKSEPSDVPLSPKAAPVLLDISSDDELPPISRMFDDRSMGNSQNTPVSTSQVCPGDGDFPINNPSLVNLNKRRAFIEDEADVDGGYVSSGNESDPDNSDGFPTIVVPDSAPIVYEDSFNSSPKHTSTRRINKNLMIVSSDDEDAIDGGFSTLPVSHDEMLSTSTVNKIPTSPEDNACDDPVDPSEEVVNTAVMQPSIQDPLMAASYKGLPLLDRLFHVEPYGYDRKNSDGQLCYARVGAIAEVMSEENVRSLFAGLVFVHHGYYVNPSRVDPSFMRNNDGRVALKEGGSFCTLLTCGVVTASHLIDSYVDAGPASNTYQQHRITAALFHQEAYRSVSLISTVLGFRSNPKGTSSSMGMSFTTKGKGRGTTFNNNDGYGTPSPKKTPVSGNKGLFTYTEAPSAPSNPVFNIWNSVLNYEDLVPIYDGRFDTANGTTTRPFRFTPQDFDALPSWRVFEGNRSEIPVDSVVAVGYTVGSYEYNGDHYINTNVKFVVVLHTPCLVVGINPPLGSTSGKRVGSSEAKKKK